VGGLAELEPGAVISAALELLGSPVAQRAQAG
jgi:hypothetical protein